MASIRLQPPEPFDFKKPDEWLRWKRRFQQFRLASGLQDESDERQVSTLLYCLGDEAEDTLLSTSITEEERKKYDEVLSKFDTFFKVRKNVIFERARFNRRNQLESESAEQFITVLYSLAENCEYGTLKDEMIRDRLVVGIRDISLSERLQMDPDLTLEKAKKTIRQREAVHEQQKLLHKECNDSEQSSVDSMRTRPKQRTKPAVKPKKSSNGNAKCSRCGKGQHSRDICPAKDAVCHNCQKRGHYSSRCYKKSVAGIVANDHSDSDSVFLDTIRSGSDTSWSSEVQMCDKIVRFKLDTGAEVTAISNSEYERISNRTLEKPSKVLYGPNHQPLDVIGQFTTTLTHKGKSTEQPVFIVKGLTTNLLGLPAIQELRLITKVESIGRTRITRNVNFSKARSYATAIYKAFPKLFQGLGNLGEEYKISLKPDAKPFALTAPRRVPLPLRKKVNDELARMEALGVISKVDKPTLWCAGMVVVPKKNSSTVRICVDLKPLNQSVLRELHPLPKVDETLAQLSGATVFSKLDANSGFWQIPLEKDSRLLTTFITPSGRYHFNKLPFGISSAPELFQKRMTKILCGLDGVLCLMDDVLVFGNSREEHNTRLVAALERIEAAGVTLNTDKCEFAKDHLKFLGHIISKDGVRADPTKTTAVLQMKPPKNIAELRRFMGMVNQLGKFSPNLAELTHPLRLLLSKKHSWTWSESQETAFSRVKAELTKPTVLGHYDPKAQTKISADASSFGLGAVLLQNINAVWKPIAYASRSMTPTETRYAQIEKEPLATTWACEKFSQYIVGKTVHIETDHKPLVPLLGTKHLDSLPPRILRFRLRLMRFDFTIQYVPGKLMYSADTLSRSPVSPVEDDELASQNRVEAFVAGITESLPASTQRLKVYSDAQANDPVCSTLISYCQSQWPEKSHLQPELKPYWSVRSELTVNCGLLLYCTRIVVPKSLQNVTLQKLHSGHQGMERCRLRALSSVWWPGLTNDIRHMILHCPECLKKSTPPSEPMIPSKLPDYPWQKVASDLFELKGVTYLLVVDYFSRFPEVARVSTTSSTSVIPALKSIFARHGIPEVLISDNGPPYNSSEMKAFASSYDFQHITSSPYYPQSNGQAERSVKTVKTLLESSNDLSMALLSYRATPFPWCGLSPAELLMGRRIRTSVPQVDKQLIPSWSYITTFREKDEQFKIKLKKNYDRRHRVRELPSIPDGQPVLVRTKDRTTSGTVVSPATTPRSYIVSTPSGQIRRNRSHLIVQPTDQPNQDSTDPNQTTAQPRSPIQTRSRTGTSVVPPQRLSYPKKGDVA